jgi:hypothetical protein
VGYTCRWRQDYFKCIYPRAVVESFMRNAILLMNAFQHFRIIPKRRRIILERNHFGGIGS